MARDQWKRPERVTLGAILVARFVLSIPGPGLLFTVVYFLNNPSLQRGFAEPLEWTSLLSSNAGYYWATFCGAFSLLASFLLQAYGKKPEYPDPRVIGTERIFSWDAILEVLVWAVSTCLSSVLMALGDRSYSPAGKMSTILSTIAFTFLACVAGVVSAKNIINTARERLTFEQFRAFVIRQALLIGRLTILTAALAIYTSLAIGSHDLPTGYVNLYGSIFPPSGVACGNESTAITLIESMPCGLTPLCGFDTWRTACWRMQLAEGVRSMNLFLPMVYVHMLIMYVLYAIYSHGEKLEQKNQWRSAINATIKKNRIAPIQEEDSLAQPESPKLADEGGPREPSEARPPPLSSNPSRSQLTPAKSLTNRSLKRISSSLMTRGVSDSHMSDKGQGGEEPKAHSSKTSYLHLFKPHMIAVLLCLVVVNAMMVYLSVRWLFLGSLFAHPMAVSNAKNLEETLQLPGVCYGSCGTSAFALFIALWILIFVILNVKELWSFLSGRKAEGKELKLQQQEEELQSQRLKAENEAGECSFYFVSADFIRKHPSNRPVPKFQRLKKIKGALIKMTLNFEALLCGQYSNSPDFCVVSHRWMTPENPDEDLAQLSAIKAHLAQNPDVKYLWYDYWSMPQGMDQTLAEKAEFRHMISNINNLFAGMKVLILLDLTYMSRFWTQYEAWLSMQSCTAEGLLPAPKSRATIVPLYNANPLLAETLESIWSQKKPQDAHTVLAEKDIAVTNQTDKELHLPKILNFDEQVKLAFQSHDQAETDTEQVTDMGAGPSSP